MRSHLGQYFVMPSGRCFLLGKPEEVFVSQQEASRLVSAPADIAYDEIAYLVAMEEKKRSEARETQQQLYLEAK